MNYLLFTLIGYLSGSILYAYWIPKIFCHKDICALSPDGNPGTANAYTYGGFFVGTAALILELFKGFIPVFVASLYLDMNSWLYSLVLIAPVLGHAFPIFGIKKGGKAIATSFGVLLGIYPVTLPVFFLIVTYISFSLILVIRPHLFRSIITFGVFFLLTFFFVPINSIRLAAFGISAIVTVRHLHAYEGETMTMSLLRP